MSELDPGGSTSLMCCYWELELGKGSFVGRARLGSFWDGSRTGTCFKMTREGLLGAGESGGKKRALAVNHSPGPQRARAAIGGRLANRLASNGQMRRRALDSLSARPPVDACILACGTTAWGGLVLNRSELLHSICAFLLASCCPDTKPLAPGLSVGWVLLCGHRATREQTFGRLGLHSRGFNALIRSRVGCATGQPARLRPRPKELDFANSTPVRRPRWCVSRYDTTPSEPTRRNVRINTDQAFPLASSAGRRSRRSPTSSAA